MLRKMGLLCEHDNIMMWTCQHRQSVQYEVSLHNNCQCRWKLDSLCISARCVWCSVVVKSKPFLSLTYSHCVECALCRAELVEICDGSFYLCCTYQTEGYYGWIPTFSHSRIPTESLGLRYGHLVTVTGIVLALIISLFWTRPEGTWLDGFLEL